MSKRENYPYKIYDDDKLLFKAKNLATAINFIDLKVPGKLHFGNVLLFTYKYGIVSYINTTERQKTIITNLLNSKIYSNE
jgi:hypothetical protein